jgi:thymidylate synthase ThyX
MTPETLAAETFTPEETRALAPYFTNVDRPIFALTNLPETVKGALFARYSRSAKSVRRLFLDEFLGQLGADRGTIAETRSVGSERADKLYARVLSEYGDDSVAQLGGAHLACEGVSNVLTKVLEWGRLMAYLEQSTRYVPYTDRPNGRWKYHVPAEIEASALRGEYIRTLDLAFDTYARWIPVMEAHFRARHPKAPEDSDAVYRSVIRAKALDTLRGLLPAATTSNVGLFGTGQAFEALLLRMHAHPLREVRDCAQQMLAELRHVIPAFLARLDQPNRGGRWIEYLAETRRGFESAAEPFLAVAAEPRDEVTLTDFDPDGELKVVAASCLRSRGGCPPTIGQRSFSRTPAGAQTAVTSRAAPSSGPAIASTSSATTAPSAICNGTGCSPSSGSPSVRAMGTSSRRRSTKPGRWPSGARSWSSRRISTSG